MYYRLAFTVAIKDSEDEDVVNEYFSRLGHIFTHVVELSSFAFDTPDTVVEILMED